MNIRELRILERIIYIYIYTTRVLAQKKRRWEESKGEARICIIGDKRKGDKMSCQTSTHPHGSISVHLLDDAFLYTS